MRRNELTILLSLAGIGLLVAFWLVVLAPKRQEAASLKDDVDQLHAQLDEARQSVAAGRQTRESFPADYRKLVVLGKAVPQDNDQASLLVQLQNLANRSGVEFQSIDLSSDTSTTSTTSATGTSTTPTTSTTASGTSAGSSDTTSTASPSSTSSGEPASAPGPVATEASAAALPIGASIGSAGLPVMRYEVKFNGGFFQIADFMKRLDAMVRTEHGAVVVTGRLLTVDSFTLSPIVKTGKTDPAPSLTADLFVTTYVTPADQGLAAGATPSGPAPASAPPASPTPASSTTPTAPTSASAPTSSTSTTP